MEPWEAVNGAITPSVVVLVDGTGGPLDDGLPGLLAGEFVDEVVEELPATLRVVVSGGRSRVVRVATVLGSLGEGVLLGGTTDGRFSSAVDDVLVNISVVLGKVVAVDFSEEIVGELSGALSTDRAAEVWVVVDGVGSTVTEGSVVVVFVVTDETADRLDGGSDGAASLEVVVDVNDSGIGVGVLADGEVVLLVVVVVVVGG